MIIQRRFAILIACLGLAVPLTLMFQDQIRQTALIPLARLFWALSLYVENIPQAIFWITLILIVIALASKNLLSSRNRPMRERGSPMRRMGAVESWMEWLRQAERGTYYQSRLAHRLTELFVAIIAHRDRLPHREVIDRIASERVNLPPIITKYLRQGLERNPWRVYYDPFLRIPFLKRREDLSILERGPKELIEYLQVELDGGVRR